jgi:hypothetical protein
MGRFQNILRGISTSDEGTVTSFKVDVEGFWQRGFDIVRNVFSVDEIRALREMAVESRKHPGDLLSNKSLSHIITDAKVLEIARSILGGDPVYFGFSSASFGVRGRGYHKDNADRHNPDAPDWKGRYTLIRMGIYLQDHSVHSGGLNLREGSHRQFSLKKGRTVYADTSLGDVIVWSLRTSHSANGVLLKFPKGLHISPRMGARTPKVLLRQNDGERVALFMTYALDDVHLERYIQYLKTRSFMIDMWRNSPLDDEIRKRSQACSLGLREPWLECEGQGVLGQNKEHADIPF